MKTKGLNCGIVGQKTRRDYEDARQLGANTVRLFVDDARLDVVVAELDKTRAAGLDVIFTSWLNETDLVKRWAPIVAECKGQVAGWDLANEPQNDDWRHIARKGYDWLRRADPNAEIIVEPDGRTPHEPLGFGRNSVHIYEPTAITHQFVSKDWRERWVYPTGPNPVAEWNRARMASIVHGLCTPGTLIGEFSCARNAPGDSSLRYVQDMISIFEEVRVDWIYHEWRGDPCWDAERPEGTSIDVLRGRNPPRRGDTPTLATIRRAFAKSG